LGGLARFFSWDYFGAGTVDLEGETIDDTAPFWAAALRASAISCLPPVRRARLGWEEAVAAVGLDCALVVRAHFWRRHVGWSCRSLFISP
jgi:hypothetical protein